MGRPKKGEEIGQEGSTASHYERLGAEITKQFGQDIFIGAESVLAERRQIIPFSPSMDIGLGGGIPEGSWLVISGKPKCGKSVSTLHFCANCQKEENGGRDIYYLNAEGRLKERDLRGIRGLNHSKFKVVQSTKEKILSAQDFLTIGENILKSHPKCVLVIDSISMLCHEKELTEGIGTSTRGGGPMLVSQFCRQMSNVVPVMDSIVVAIVQLMANTSGYGASIVEKGGNAIVYQQDVKLKCKGIEEWKDGNNRIGQKVNWVVETSALDASPGQEVTSYLRYGVGIDELTELIELSSSLGLIKQAGSWLSSDFLKDEQGEILKFQGKERLCEFLSDKPTIQVELRKGVNSFFGLSNETKEQT